MAKKSADIRNYANDLLQQALEQLDDVKTAIARSRDKLEADLHKARQERVRLLQELGEQTLSLVNQGKVKLPGRVQTLIDKLNEALKGQKVTETVANQPLQSQRPKKRRLRRRPKRNRRRKLLKRHLQRKQLKRHRRRRSLRPKRHRRRKPR